MPGGREAAPKRGTIIFRGASYGEFEPPREEAQRLGIGERLEVIDFAPVDRIAHRQLSSRARL